MEMVLGNGFNELSDAEIRDYNGGGEVSQYFAMGGAAVVGGAIGKVAGAAIGEAVAGPAGAGVGAKVGEVAGGLVGGYVGYLTDKAFD